MKKILLPIIAIAFSMLSANAQEEPVLISAGEFTNIVLGNNMKVVLKPIEDAAPGLKLNAQAIENLNVEIFGRTLYLNSGKGQGQVIYVLVDKLQTLSLGADTDLNTEGFLQAGKIDLYLENGAKARLRTTGKINAFPLGDFDINTTSSPIPGPAKVNVL